MGSCCSKNQENSENELEKGIVKIQANFRGAIARKELKKGDSTSNRMKKLAPNDSFYTEEPNDHAPKHQKAMKVSVFPVPENPGLSSIEQKKGKFQFEENQAEEANLPVLGPYMLKDGVVYEGQWKNGMRHGRGKAVWKDGSIYEGYWADDMANGKGRMIHKNGDIYEGDWRDDKAWGIGEYIHLNGATYHGSWVNDKQVKKKSMTWKNRCPF